MDKELADLKKRVEQLEKGSKPKKVKDPNAPKRPLTEYQKFVKATTAEMKAEKEKAGEKYDHKAAFGMAAKLWELKKKESEKDSD